MNKDTLNLKMQAFFSKEWLETFRGIKRGFEKECLRVDKRGMIANTPHPKVLGSSLTHPMIVTDFSEAQLEFITPPTENIDLLMNTLTELHHFTYQILEGEYLWTASMPSHLPKKEIEIPIALYGESNSGKLKHVYRQGLGLRYGRFMQTISGIHYNFSLPLQFWEKYHYALKREDALKDFISEQYLGLLRNCLRYGWLLTLLFGASPAMDSKFIKQAIPHLEKFQNGTLYGDYATSLRLSDLGYSSNRQEKAHVSYNSFKEYIQSMYYAVHTVHPTYSQIGIKKNNEYQQLSDSILQVEDEHYCLFRPKRVTSADERMLSLIMKEGIEYVEVRALDINPFVPIGITDETVYFLDCFLLACLFTDSPPLTRLDYERIKYNQDQVSNYGRKPGLSLRKEEGYEVNVLDWAKDILFAMDAVGKLLDKAYESNVFSDACWKLNTLPSARILAEMNEKSESYCDFALRWSMTHQLYFKTKPMLPESFAFYRHLTEESFKLQKKLESSNQLTFEEYLRKYLQA